MTRRLRPEEHPTGTGTHSVRRARSRTAHLPREASDSRSEECPPFSPDGPTLAYIHRDLGLGQGGSYPSGIYTLDLASLRTVPRYLGYARTVDWTRDGRALVFDDPAGTHSLDTTSSSQQLISYGEAYFPSCAAHADPVAFDNLADVGLAPSTPDNAVFPPSLSV
jgi:hypothetical protein